MPCHFGCPWTLDFHLAWLAPCNCEMSCELPLPCLLMRYMYHHVVEFNHMYQEVILVNKFTLKNMQCQFTNCMKSEGREIPRKHRYPLQQPTPENSCSKVSSSEQKDGPVFFARRCQGALDHILLSIYFNLQSHYFQYII